MAEIIMPKVGDAMTEGKVVRWYKKAGDSVKQGEPVAEIETDKVNMDLEADEAGVIDQVLAEEGAMVAVGAAIATLREEGAPASATAPRPAAAPAEPEQRIATGAVASRPAEERAKPKAVPTVSAVPPPEAPAAPAERGGGERTKSSPLARRMAREMEVDLAAVAGSGPRGRIVAADIERAAKGGVSAAPAGAKAPLASPAAKSIEGRDIPLTAMRRTIAKRLAESIGPIPHFFLTIETDVTSLLELREQLNEIHGTKASINDFVIRACALAMLQHPAVNSSFGAEAIRQHGEIHIGVAVATPEGLITPVIRNADSKSVIDIAAEVRALAEKARNRKLMPDEYQGSTFTVSNLGMFGIDEFTAIINPPNSAILAVGAAMAKPVVVDRHVRVRERMRVTLSCDHRVIDGATGAGFLQTLQKIIEQPLRLVT